MKKFFPTLRVRDVSILGLLMAITALLSIFCTFRIGTVVKIPMKFISVFVTALLYGPVYGGLVAAVGDLLNCLLAPVGPIIPQITVIEFLSGFLYGIFFLKSDLTRREYCVAAFFCCIAQLVLDMAVTTAVFALWLKWYPGFAVAFITRLPAGLVKLVLQLLVLTASYTLTQNLKLLKQKGVKTSK